MENEHVQTIINFFAYVASVSISLCAAQQLSVRARSHNKISMLGYKTNNENQLYISQSSLVQHVHTLYIYSVLTSYNKTA